MHNSNNNNSNSLFKTKKCLKEESRKTLKIDEGYMRKT